MARRLLVLVLLTLVLAAIESVALRLRSAHPPDAAELYVQACLLWGAFGVLALGPAVLTARVAARVRGHDRAAAHAYELASLLGWMALPVAGHALLDRYTGLGANMAELRGWRPWAELVGALVTSVLVLVFLGSRFRRLSTGARAAWGVGIATLAIACAMLLPPGTRAGAGLPAKVDETRPNILLLVWDTTRSDHLTPYGYQRDTTPHLYDLARDAILFENARSVSCFTFTSHLSMLTGVHPSKHGARMLDASFDRDRAVSLAELLNEAGYRTGAFVGTGVLSSTTGIDWGFETYDDRVDPPVCDTYAWGLVHDLQAIAAERIPALRCNGQPHWIQDFQRPAEDVLERALAWIRAPDPRPWFCMVNLYDVHWPYVPAEDGRELLVQPYEGPMDGYLFRSDRFRAGYEPDEEDRRHLRELYDAEMWELDRAVDSFLGDLDLEDAAVLITSDHGEAFGEAGQWKHEDVYEPQVRVPFLLRLPSAARAGERSSVPVSGVDVAPTLTSIAGLAPHPSWTGIDALTATCGPEREILVEHRDSLDPSEITLAFYRGSWKLVRREKGGEVRLLLHDLERDPIGERDLASEQPELAAELAAALEAFRARWGGDEQDDRSFEGKNAEALRALGYIGHEQ